MAVTQRAPQVQPDAAPLWLPRHDAVVVDQSAARPPDSVQGYSLPDRLKTAFLGSHWKIATTVATLLASLMFIATVPSLFGAGIGGLIKMAIYQSWTIGLMLIVTVRVRSVSIGTVARYWLAGFFTVAMTAYFANGPLSALADPSSVWITPILEELLKAVPLAVAIFMGHRVWRHPGLSDLMLLGFAVGGGYAFHEEALWERAAVSGFELNAGILIPSVFQADGIFVVGHAVWTSIIAMAIGLVLLHRHQAFAVVASLFAIFLVVVDHMAINDSAGTLGWARQLVFNGKLLALIFVVAVAAAVVLDRQRQSLTAARDHLFPSDRSHGTRPLEHEDDDLLKPLLASRYRRLRNGVHNTVDATMQQWPPRSEARPAPIEELARLGRAADVAVGPGTSSTGWAPDPETPSGFRFVGPNGFTAYAAGEVIVETPLAAPAVESPPVEQPDLADPDLTDEERAELQGAAAEAQKQADKAAKQAAKAAKKADADPTTVSISTPKARVEAAGASTLARQADYWQYFGLAVVAAGLFTLVRLLTAGEPSTALIETSLSLPDATNSPALIRGLLGALVAGVAIRGRNAAVVGGGWEVGPGDDPRPDRPDECEA